MGKEESKMREVKGNTKTQERKLPIMPAKHLHQLPTWLRSLNQVPISPLSGNSLPSASHDPLFLKIHHTAKTFLIVPCSVSPSPLKSVCLLSHILILFYSCSLPLNLLLLYVFYTIYVIFTLSYSF